MSIPVHCKRCGYRGAARSLRIENSTDVTFHGGSENCLQCGGRAELHVGTYDFVGDVVSAFIAPGMTREKVEAAKKIAEDAAKGDVSSDEAIQLLRVSMRIWLVQSVKQAAQTNSIGIG